MWVADEEGEGVVWDDVGLCAGGEVVEGGDGVGWGVVVRSGGLCFTGDCIRFGVWCEGLGFWLAFCAKICCLFSFGAWSSGFALAFWDGIINMKSPDFKLP